MKFKTNAIIGLIFLGLLGFVYFYEIIGGDQRRQEAEKSKRLLDFTEGHVRRLALGRGDTSIVLQKGTDGWRLSSPVVDRADQEAVERYLRNLGESEREKTVVDNASVTGAEAAKYALDAPRLTIELETEDGEKQEVKWGADSPTDRFTYAQIGGANPEIFVVRAWRFDNLDKSLFDFRDRKVLAFAKDEVVELRRKGPDGEFVLVRDQETWQMRQPVSALADGDAVNALLNKIDTSEIEAFIDEGPDQEALKAYGFGPHKTELTMLVGPDKVEKRLVIGGDNGQGSFYARDASRPQVFLLDSTLVQQAVKDANALRDKKPLRFDKDSITEIALGKQGKQVFAAAKDTAGIWDLTDPPGREGKSRKLNSLLGDLNQLEVVGFAGEVPEGAVLTLVIALTGDGKDSLVISVHQVDGVSYLRQEGDPAVYIMDAEDFAEFDLGLEDVAQAPPKPADSAGGADGG